MISYCDTDAMQYDTNIAIFYMMQCIMPTLI